MHVCNCACLTYQGEVGLGDSAVLEAAVRSAGSGLIEGDTKSPTRGEIQLMTEPVGERERNMLRLLLLMSMMYVS